MIYKIINEKFYGYKLNLNMYKYCCFKICMMTGLMYQHI